MSFLNRPAIGIIVRTYLAGSLLLAAFLSTPGTAFVPVVLLLACGISWSPRVRRMVRLIADFFLLFATALVWTPFLGPALSFLVSIPAFVLIARDLQEDAAHGAPTQAQSKFSLTPSGLMIGTISAVSLVPDWCWECCCVNHCYRCSG